MMLSETPDPVESAALEHRNRTVMKERCGDGSTFDSLGVALHRSSPETSDFLESAVERGRRDPFAPVLAVDEEARDSPVRKGRHTLGVRASAFDARQLVSGPELSTAYAARAIVHEHSVSPAFPNSALLLRSVLPRGLGAAYTLGVKGHAPAASPHAVVHHNEPREVRPSRLVQRCNTKGGHRCH